MYIYIYIKGLTLIQLILEQYASTKVDYFYTDT